MRIREGPGTAMGKAHSLGAASEGTGGFHAEGWHCRSTEGTLTSPSLEGCGEI